MADTVHDLIQQCCGELPEFWSIKIELEHGYGCVVLENDWGDDVQIDSDPEGGIAAKLACALKTAKKQAAYKASQEIHLGPTDDD